MHFQAGSGCAGMDVDSEAASPSRTVLCGARSAASNVVQIAISEEKSLWADAVNAGEKMLETTPDGPAFVFTKKSARGMRQEAEGVPPRFKGDFDVRQHFEPG